MNHGAGRIDMDRQFMIKYMITEEKTGGTVSWRKKQSPGMNS